MLNIIPNEKITNITIWICDESYITNVSEKIEMDDT